jgi:hypothetical protein
VKPLVNTLIKHLDTLISLIESVDSLTWYKSELQELGKNLKNLESPLFQADLCGIGILEFIVL